MVNVRIVIAFVAGLIAGWHVGAFPGLGSGREYDVSEQNAECSSLNARSLDKCANGNFQRGGVR